MKGHLMSLEYSKVRVRRHTGSQKGYMLGGFSVQDGSVSVEREAEMGQLIWGDRDT